MKGTCFLPISILSFLCTLVLFQSSVSGQSLKETNDRLFEQIQHIHGLFDKQMDSIRAIFRESGYIGQGNPAITEHPLTPDR